MKQTTPPKPLIVLFDLDSTLTTTETVDAWAAEKGIASKLQQVTNDAMQKGQSLHALFTQRLALLAPSKQDRAQLRRIALHNLSHEAIQLIDKLSKHSHVRLGILSLHFQEIVNDVGSFLGCDPELCIGYEIQHDKDGAYQGYDIDQVLIQDGGKGRVVDKLKSLYPNTHIVHIGDNMTDQSTQGHADMFIGYGGVIEREEVKKASTNYAYNFDEVEEYLKKYL